MLQAEEKVVRTFDISLIHESCSAQHSRIRDVLGASVIHIIACIVGVDDIKQLLNCLTIQDFS